MKRLATLFALLGLLAGAAAHGADDWRLIEFDMRNAGCFKPPRNMPEASVIGFCPDSLAGEGAIVTTCRAGDGTLKLITWSD